MSANFFAKYVSFFERKNEKRRCLLAMEQREIIREIRRTIQMEANAVKILLDTVDMEKAAIVAEKIGTM